jgi:hypothetical protein
MPKAKYPDVLEVWGFTWTKQGKVWVGPAVTDPEDRTLALAVEHERIIRRGGYYVMVDPSITLDRFGWTEEDAEGLTLTGPDGEPLDDEEDA